MDEPLNVDAVTVIHDAVKHCINQRAVVAADLLIAAFGMNLRVEACSALLAPLDAWFIIRGSVGWLNYFRNDGSDNTRIVAQSSPDRWLIWTRYTHQDVYCDDQWPLKHPLVASCQQTLIQWPVATQPS